MFSIFNFLSTDFGTTLEATHSYRLIKNKSIVISLGNILRDIKKYVKGFLLGFLNSVSQVSSDKMSLIKSDLLRHTQ